VQYDLFLKSVLTDDNGNFTLNNCLIPSGYKLFISASNKIELILLEAFISSPGSFTRRIPYQNPELEVNPRAQGVARAEV
jgi:hypothetical protein